jgi:hypothetical protein
MKRAKFVVAFVVAGVAFSAMAQDSCTTEECRNRAAQAVADIVSQIKLSQPENEACDAICELKKAQAAGSHAARVFTSSMSSGNLGPLLKAQALLRYACDMGAISSTLDPLISDVTNAALKKELGNSDPFSNNDAAREWAVAEQALQGMTFGYSVGFASANTARFKSAGNSAQQENEKNVTCAATAKFANELLEAGQS